MKNRHKMKKAAGGSIPAAVKSEASSKSDSFKSGGKTKVGMASGGKGAARADRKPRRADGGSLSSASRTEAASNGGSGAGHENA